MFKVKIYVVHASFLDLRKPMLESLVKKLNDSKKFTVNIEYVTAHDPDKLDAAEIKKYVDLTKKPDSTDVFESLIKNMHIKHVSNVMKHFECLKRIAADKSKTDHFIILEDDVVYGDDIVKRLEDVLTMTSTDTEWDMMFLGFPSLSPIANDTYQFKKTSEMFKILPCCDSYIMKKATAERLVESFLPIKFTTVVQYSYLIEKGALNAKMCFPNIFVDGTKLGVYLSSLEPNNRLFLNTDYNRLSSIVRKDGAFTAEEEKEIKSLVANMKFKTHPDIQYLVGMYEYKKGNFAVAKEIFDAAYNLYTQNGCIINNESEFLMTYMSIFKHFQDV